MGRGGNRTTFSVGTSRVQVLGRPQSSRFPGCVIHHPEATTLENCDGLWTEEQGNVPYHLFKTRWQETFFLLLLLHQHSYLCVKMLLRKVFRGKVDNCLAKANHFPLEGEKLFAQFVGEEEPRAEDRPIQPQRRT